MSESLEIAGYGGQLVPNKYIRNEKSTSVLCMLLPGAGYTCDMPLLYYAENLSVDKGWEVLRVECDYANLPSDTSRDELLDRLVTDCRSALEAGIAQRDRRHIVIVGKSLGTIAMAYFQEQLEDFDVRHVWLTPLLRRVEIRDAIIAVGDKSLVVIGSNDTHFDAGIMAELNQAGVMNHIVDGADHGMGISGDVRASISALGSVYEAIEEFLGEF